MHELIQESLLNQDSILMKHAENTHQKALACKSQFRKAYLEGKSARLYEQSTDFSVRALQYFD